jgi:predicted amidohydrolase YtcJ
MLLRNARIGLEGPRRDIEIAGGRIAAIAPGIGDKGIGDKGMGDKGVDLVDLDGAVVLPGLWDAHVHAVQWAQARRRVDLSGARSAAEAAALLPGGSGLVMGYGFRDALWPDVPDKALLPDRPAVLVSNDLHTAWFSAAALALIGHPGHPTGVLRERACYEAMAALPPPPAKQLDEWVAEATRAAAARGVTGILDFEYADNWSDWRRRAAAHDIATRVVCSIPVARLDDAIARNLRTGHTEGLLQVGPVKMFVDGSLNTRTAYCEDPYQGGGDRGLLETPPEELTAAMAKAHEHGLHPAVHAIGDRAVAIALDAYDTVGCPGRIEHAQLVRPADVARFARPGLVTSVQPAHAPDDRDVADALWPARTGRAYAYKDLLDAGAALEFGSDAPVSPLDPWDAIASAVTRTDDGRPAWHPEQAVTLADALRSSSRGSVAVGAAADLVIIEGEPDDLRAPVIFGTLLAGEWTFRA